MAGPSSVADSLEKARQKNGRTPAYGVGAPNAAGQARGDRRGSARGRRWAATGHAKDSALRRGTTTSRGTACCRAPGNGEPRERRPTEMCRGAGARGLADVDQASMTPEAMTACSLCMSCVPPAIGAGIDRPAPRRRDGQPTS